MSRCIEITSWDQERAHQLSEETSVCAVIKLECLSTVQWSTVPNYIKSYNNPTGLAMHVMCGERICVLEDSHMHMYICTHFNSQTGLLVSTLFLWVYFVVITSTVCIHHTFHSWQFQSHCYFIWSVENKSPEYNDINRLTGFVVLLFAITSTKGFTCFFLLWFQGIFRTLSLWWDIESTSHNR